MFTALAMICMMDGPPNCMAVSSRLIFTSLEDCERDIGSAMLFAESQGRYVQRYECFNWGEDV
jgi:hypothetical protein